ncbi:MAG: substrate-binding domain-containing protein [Spirochaetota bacterium]|nr:MAG: substrate-binding domain-containing protein [Spirochaetota bacterium]
MKKFFLLLTLLLFIPALFLFAGEEEEAGAGAEMKKGEDFHFIMVNNMVTLPYFMGHYKGAELACKEISAATGDKVTFEVVGPAEMDLMKQVEAFEAAFAKKPDGFMVVAWDAEVVQATINKAMAQGIPTICIDGDSPISNRISYIGTDWTYLGREIGEALAPLINYRGKVAMLGLVGAENMEEAFASFREVMAQYPDVEIVALEHDNGEEIEAARITRALIQKYPDLAGIAGFDAGSGPGMATALRETGKAGKIMAVANNITTAHLQAIKNGELQYIIGERERFFGYYGVLWLYLHLKSNFKVTDIDEKMGIAKLPPRVITGVIFVNKESVDAFWDVYEGYQKAKFTYGKPQ